MKCAIIEYHHYHDVTFPTLVYLLRQAGISQIDFFTSQPNIARNIWGVTNTPATHITCSDGRLFALSEFLGRFSGYDFLIINTCDPPKHYFSRMLRQKLPLLGIFHNASQYRQDQDYVDFFACRHRQMLVLGSHVADYLADTIQTHWVLPCYLGEPHLHESPQKPTFCVQGLIEYSRRNYLSVIQAVAELRDSGITEFTVKLLGGACQSPDQEHFQQEIARHHLCPFFEFVEGDIPYDDYFTHIRNTDFLLFLLDTTHPNYQFYATEKVSSSLAISLGLNTLPILHKDFACTYQLESSTITYRNGTLAEAMRQALGMDSENRKWRRIALQQRQQQILRQSAINLKIALDEILA